MNPEEFLSKFNEDYPNLSSDKKILNQVIQDIFNYWSPIQREISESEKGIFSSMKFDTSWTQFNLGKNLLRAERSDDRIYLTFFSEKENNYYPINQEIIIGEIFPIDGKAIYHSTSQEFKVSDLDEFFKLLLA